MGSDVCTTGEKKSSRKFNSGLWARDQGQPRARRAGPGSEGSPGPSRRGGGGGGARAVTHRTAVAAVLLAAPAIQLRRRAPPRVCRAPPRVCPARPGRPAPGPEPPPVCGHVTRDLSGTRRAAHRGVGGSGCRGALPLRGHGGPGRPTHFRSGRTGGGRKWETQVPRSAGLGRAEAVAV